MKAVFDSEAVLEAREAAAFYEDCQPGLGHAFLNAIEAAIPEIAHQPLLWRRIKGRFRRYLLPRFPYGLIYAVEEDQVYIAAVMHLKRKPGYWVSRTRSK